MKKEHYDEVISEKILGVQGVLSSRKRSYEAVISLCTRNYLSLLCQRRMDQKCKLTEVMRWHIFVSDRISPDVTALFYNIVARPDYHSSLTLVIRVVLSLISVITFNYLHVVVYVISIGNKAPVFFSENLANYFTSEVSTRLFNNANTVIRAYLYETEDESQYESLRLFSTYPCLLFMRIHEKILLENTNITEGKCRSQSKVVYYGFFLLRKKIIDP
ncbi:hypothetical protein DICVIV_01970 [Dictyocaulus viviparus]|uniref:Uncharacterized protein n=1 Tax=Dictyocaulus viviparus TaxID=29172 RepID=A0A0D8YBG2_DICVI|nr:hypothetical protein DICVIV_01970 [Dictyocaulus viviparus]